MRITIVHDTVTDEDAPDAMDVLHQAKAVRNALKRLGHSTDAIACTTDFERLRSDLSAVGTDAVFNLVESLEGRGRLIHLLPAFLDAMAMPYTGAPADAIMATSNKAIAKCVMTAAGLPTPVWTGPHPPGPGNRPLPEDCRGTWIVKSVWEHASIGLDASSIVTDPSPEDLAAILSRQCKNLGGACFAERFVDGREFNLSLLSGPTGPEVLPPAEILFEGYEATMPRIVDYGAKWDESTYAYHHTPRRFEFDACDRPLVERLSRLAISCWRVFGLAGYARVDFRVDASSRPWILEVNTNPCLSPDAGFAAALQQAGIPFERALERIFGDMREKAADRSPSRVR